MKFNLLIKFSNENKIKEKYKEYYKILLEEIIGTFKKKSLTFNEIKFYNKQSFRHGLKIRMSRKKRYKKKKKKELKKSTKKKKNGRQKRKSKKIKRRKKEGERKN
eukprot:TRINITY_DN1133_c0_g1_i1.p1 TRINITY_DN1133_c0_g1~~TRINITY_DN1133_c0_g1_i1.p1  ORF type:complete len:118 (-),score=22.99 TRINITY_DN1133_c0_g1_i1:8-322(-)